MRRLRMLFMRWMQIITIRHPELFVVQPQIKSVRSHDNQGFADLPQLFHIVRSTFVDQYDGFNLFESLREQVGWYIDDKKSLKAIKAPERGDLDLEQVVKSDYCFL